MKIGMQTWGSEGDIRPFIALAAGLRSAGHEVTLATTHIENRDYAAVGEPLGISMRQAGRIDQADLHAAGVRLVRITNTLRQVRMILEDLFEPYVNDMYGAAKRLCEENDVVIGHHLVHPLQAAAELAARPRVSVFLAPLLPSRHIPPPGAPDLGGFLNGALWKAGGALFSRMLLPPIAGLRRRIGLPPVRSVMHDVFLSPFLNLVGASPTLCPEPPDWNGRIRTCGAFSLPDSSGPKGLPREVREFLDAGPPPVYMTFGSMSAADPAPDETTALLAEASRLSGRRAIIQTDWVRAGKPDGSLSLHCPGSVDHGAVFPRCAAVVHHGGAGTSHAAAQAGVPSIVVEHATDQAFWGGVLHRAGIAPRLLHRRTVTARTLAAAIGAVLLSGAMRERAQIIAQAMQAEDGVGCAVSLIGERMAGWRGAVS